MKQATEQLGISKAKLLGLERTFGILVKRDVNNYRVYTRENMQEFAWLIKARSLYDLKTVKRIHKVRFNV